MKFILADERTIIRDSLIAWAHLEQRGTVIHFQDGSEHLFSTDIFKVLVRELPAERFYTSNERPVVHER